MERPTDRTDWTMNLSTVTENEQMSTVLCMWNGGENWGADYMQHNNWLLKKKQPAKGVVLKRNYFLLFKSCL